MPYEIRWTAKAAKGYDRLDIKTQPRVREAIQSLSLNPRPQPHSKKLEPKSAGFYSLRIGIHYRAVYRIDDAARCVLVLDVSSREGAY